MLESTRVRRVRGKTASDEFLYRAGKIPSRLPTSGGRSPTETISIFSMITTPIEDSRRTIKAFKNHLSNRLSCQFLANSFDFSCIWLTRCSSDSAIICRTPWQKPKSKLCVAGSSKLGRGFDKPLTQSFLRLSGAFVLNRLNSS